MLITHDLGILTFHFSGWLHQRVTWNSARLLLLFTISFINLVLTPEYFSWIGCVNCYIVPSFQFKDCFSHRAELNHQKGIPVPKSSFIGISGHLWVHIGLCQDPGHLRHSLFCCHLLLQKGWLLFISCFSVHFLLDSFLVDFFIDSFCLNGFSNQHLSSLFLAPSSVTPPPYPVPFLPPHSFLMPSAQASLSCSFVFSCPLGLHSSPILHPRKGLTKKLRGGTLSAGNCFSWRRGRIR